MDPHMAASAQSRLPMPLPIERTTLGLLLVGLLPRPQSTTTFDHGCEKALAALAERTLPSLRRHVLLPHFTAYPNGLVAVHGHTWGCSRVSSMPQAPPTHELRNLLRSHLADNGSRQIMLGSVVSTETPSPASVNATNNRATAPFYFLLSMKRGLAMISDNPFTLMMRWDLVFYAPFRSWLLDQSLLYRASWCRAVRPGAAAAAATAPSAAAAKTSNSACLRLQPLRLPRLSCSDAEGIPDFYLAGLRATLRLALGGAAKSYADGGHAWPRKACPNLHGILAAILERASETHHIQLGRYLHHQLDYDIIRQPHAGRRFDDSERGAPSNGSLWRVLPARDDAAAVALRQPQHPSLCPTNLVHCGCAKGGALGLPPVACTELS